MRTGHDEPALDLLTDLVDRGPVPVVDLLSAQDLCESDLHGLLAEFRAAGLVVQVEVAGEPGYDATPTGREAIERLRERGAESD